MLVVEIGEVLGAGLARQLTVRRESQRSPGPPRVRPPGSRPHLRHQVVVQGVDDLQLDEGPDLQAVFRALVRSTFVTPSTSRACDTMRADAR